MKKLSLIALALLVFATPAYASEVTGTLSTGISTGVQGTVAATPSASPLPGTYSSVQNVTLSASSADNIRYTIDATAPTCSTGNLYSSTISVGSSQTIRAIGCYNGTASQIGTFAYGINITSPGGGGVGVGGGGGGSTTPPPSGNKPGDVNSDNDVDILDFNSIFVDWGKTGTSLNSDLNRDGVVDLFDFNILIINWSIL